MIGVESVQTEVGIVGRRGRFTPELTHIVRNRYPISLSKILLIKRKVFNLLEGQVWDIVFLFILVGLLCYFQLECVYSQRKVV